MTEDRINNLFQYFKNIIKKYPDKIDNLLKKAALSANTYQIGQKVYDDDFSKAKYFFIQKGKDKELLEIFKNLKKKNTSATDPQHNTSTIVPGALSNQNKIDKSYEELIQQLDEILKNPNLKQKINIINKTLILSHIFNIAEKIKKLVNIYKLPRFNDEEKAKILIFKLSGLISIYKLILSNNSSNKQRANYLNSIYRNLTPRSNLPNT